MLSNISSEWWGAVFKCVQNSNEPQCCCLQRAGHWRLTSVSAESLALFTTACRGSFRSNFSLTAYGQKLATKAGLLFKINPLLWLHGEKIGCHIIHFTLTILEQKCTIQSIWMCHHFSLQIQIACRYADGHSPQSSFWTARAWWPLSTSASCLHSHCASLASHSLPCILIVFCHCIFSLYSHYSIVSL